MTQTTRPVPINVRQRWSETIQTLLRIEAPLDKRGEPGVTTVKFSRGAYDSWKDFQKTIERQMREGERLARIRDWASKLPGATVRLAGGFHALLHVGDPIPPEIDQATTEAALNLGAILSSHALAVFGLMEKDQTVEDAQKILAWFAQTGKSESTVRDVFCAHQGRFKRVDALVPAITLLEAHGYIRRRTSKGGGPGRPSEVLEVNPALTRAIR